eukprot:UC1_evm1s1883
MVFQYGQSAPFWGMSAPGATLTVTLQQQQQQQQQRQRKQKYDGVVEEDGVVVDYDDIVTLKATADTTGRWEVMIPAQPATAPTTLPYAIAITATTAQALTPSAKTTTASLTLTDIVFGNVFICSGQSNMELAVGESANATYFVSRAGQYAKRLRYAQVAILPQYGNVSLPQSNLTMGISWGNSDSSTVPGLSAMCYFFGVEQVTAHPSVPVGLVASSWGGTAIEVAPWPDHEAGIIAGIRYAQELATTTLQNVGMVVTADIGDPAGCHHPIHPPWKQEVGRRASVEAERLVWGDTAGTPAGGPRVVSAVWDAWSPTWGSYHHDSGVSNVCKQPNSFGWRCGGLRVTFDRPIVLRSLYGAVYGQGDGTGFELWNDQLGSAALGGTSVGSRQLASSLCTDCSKCPCMQPLALTGNVLADGKTLQFNTTYVSGVPHTLKYAMRDYPTMIVYEKG